MKKIILAIFIISNISLTASAQQKYWSARSENNGVETDKAVARQSFPKEFKLFNLNADPLRQQLFSVTDNKAKNSAIISLPNADGNLEQFEIVEASNFEPDLQAKFPEIRAFSGKGITDKFAVLKLSISPQGIQTMVFRTDKENEFIEPYSKDHTTYAVYKSRREKDALPWTCSTDDKVLFSDLKSSNAVTNASGSSTGELKTLRLAQSCNGEYANFFGATSVAQVAVVLAAFNATLTRCNGCYEKDLALHLNLIAATTNVIYYNPATDPYSTTLSAWNLQLQKTLTANIGEANYDIGHMFGASGGGGNAGCIGCVCVSPTLDVNGIPIANGKGSGITSPADGIPMGDNFDIDYVVHEVGHQLGANHTYSHVDEGTGVNKEVGSGITIMGYAGITSRDVAPHSIDVYHEASIQQIQTNLATKSCPVTTNISANNAAPVVGALSNFAIPISTPFVLTGSATDVNGDPLTYSWEQNDNSTTPGANSVASPTKLTGPNWLSFSPSASPVRFFPRLSTILAGLSVTGPLPGGDAGANIEALSSVGRILNFRLTVRDNAPYTTVAPVKVGQTAFNDMAITVDATTGPFLLTSQNSAITYAAGSTQGITWSVNGTDGAPINCANVKISLSTDGGVTFPTVLAASTPNDGSENITLPCIVSTTARIKIEAIGNIFFDINNSDFSIQQGFNLNTPAAVLATCPVPATLTQTLESTTSCGFANNITFTATGNPAGTTVSFSSNPIAPGANTVVTLNGANTLTTGTYVITVTGAAAGALPKTSDITFIIPSITPPAITTQPVAQTVCTGTNVTFSVAGTDIAGYQWQVSTAAVPAFTNIPGATAASFVINPATIAANGNQYRVVVSNCAASVNSTAVLLTVIAPVVVAIQPAATAEICSGTNASFTVAGTSSQPVIYQWQVNTGGGFTNIGNAAPYSGANTATLTITAAPVSLSGTTYRALLSNSACSTPVVSNSSVFTVRQTPTVGLSAAPLLSLTPGQTTTLTATPSVQTTGVLTTSWFKNGAAITNTGNTRIINVENTGAYQVKIQEVFTGGLTCANQSAIVTIEATPSDKLFVFPTPNDGQFTVSYYNNGGNNTTRSVTVYDSRGTRVKVKTFSVSGPYTLLSLDIRPAQKGIYYIVVGDANGKVLARRNIAVQ